MSEKKHMVEIDVIELSIMIFSSSLLNELLCLGIKDNPIFDDAVFLTWKKSRGISASEIRVKISELCENLSEEYKLYE